MSACKVPVPTTPEPYLGIEIEHFYPTSTRGYDAQAENKDPKFILNQEFCSGASTDRTQFEGKLLVRQDRYERPLSEALELIKKHGALTDIGFGVHVHVDTRKEIKRDRQIQRDWVEEHRQHLLKLVHQERVRLNRWGGFASGYYNGVNFVPDGAPPKITSVRGYQTFEVRCLGNTLDFTEIKTFIDELVKLVESCPSNTPPAFSQSLPVAA